MSKLSWLAEIVKKHKKLLIIGVIGVTVAGIGVAVVSNMNRKKEQMMAMMNQPQTSKVEKRTLVSSVSATGTITSVNSKDICANLSGMEVKSISVEVGDMVEAGQVICVLDSEEIKENLSDAQTALNVANEKKRMDLTAAERNLQDVLEDYNLDLDRANQELLSVFQDYEEALKDVEEAKEEWDKAIQTTKDYKEEYDYQNGLFKNAEEKKNSTNSASAHSQEFNITKNMLNEYVNNLNTVDKKIVTLNNAVESRLVIGRDLSNITVKIDEDADFKINAQLATDSNNDAAKIKEQIEGYLAILKDLSSRYNNSNNIDESYNTYKQEASTWESKYNSAKQAEESAEKAYEQAVSALESSIEAYEKQLRNIDDAKKSGETSILSKSESLYSTQLNTLTSGDSEEKKIEEYQEQLQDCTVKAPISGVVTAVNVEAGDMYNGSAIVTIEDISGYEVSTEIDEYEIGKIEKGQKVIVKTNATGDEELEGTVNWISPRASSGGSEVTYTVKVTLDTTHEMLRMDMTAKLSIILESKENVLTVPYEAVQEDESGKFYVEVVTNDVKADSEGGENTPMPEGMESGEMPQMPEGMKMGKMPQMPSGTKKGSNTKGKGSGTPGESMGNADINTKKVYVEKGIESDYYIEIISNEISEGMEIVVPSSEKNGGGMDIQGMMMRQGPMGGF